MTAPPPRGHLEWLQVSLFTREAQSQYVAVAFVDTSDPTTVTFYGSVVLTDWRNNPDWPSPDSDPAHKYIKRTLTLELSTAGIMKRADAEALFGGGAGTFSTAEEFTGDFSDPTVEFGSAVGTWDDLQAEGAGHWEDLLAAAEETETIVSNGFKKDWQGWSFPNGDAHDPGGWNSAARVDGGTWDEGGGRINEIPDPTLYAETTTSFPVFTGSDFSPPAVLPSGVTYPQALVIGWLWSATLTSLKWHKIGQPVPIRVKARMGIIPGGGGDPTDETDIGASLDKNDEDSIALNETAPASLSFLQVSTSDQTRRFTFFAIYAPDIGQDYD